MKEEDVGDCLLCRPQELCCSLHIFMCWEIDATLLCCIALRYIGSNNEIEFLLDWMGWWHQYEIAPLFPCLLCVLHKDTSSCLVGHLTCISLHWLNRWTICLFSNDSFRPNAQSGSAPNCPLLCLLCFFLSLNDAQEMTGIGCKFCSVQCHKEKEGKRVKRRQFSYVILWRVSITIETYRANRFLLVIMQIVDVTCESRPSMMRQEGSSPTPPLLLPLALAMLTDPPILGRFHTPPPSPYTPTPSPTPCLHPPFLLLLPACVLSFLFSLRCCYSNGEMWEYLRPSERGKGCWGWGEGGARGRDGKRERMGDRQRVKG